MERSKIGGRYNVNFENVPAFNERKRMDRDQDGQISEEEAISYVDSLLTELQDGAQFELDGRRLRVSLTNGTIELGKNTILPEPFQVQFDINLEKVGLNGVHRLDFWDLVYSDNVPPKALVQVRGDLRVLKQWHPEKRTFGDRRGTSAVLDAPFSLIFGPERYKDRIRAALLTSPRFGAPGDAVRDVGASGPSLPFIVFALAIAGFLGVMRGGEATSRIAHRGKAMHTAAVLPFGALAVCVAHYLLPPSAMPWIAGPFGLLVACAGVWMLVAMYTHGSSGAHSHAGRAHSHPHDHDHDPATSARGYGSSGALAVLLSAVALNRLPFGLAMLAAFGLGLGAVLVLRRSAGERTEAWPRAFSLIGGVALVILGLSFALRALMEGGILVINL